MPIVSAKTNKTVKNYNLDQLKKAANYMRGLNLIALNCAGSGHAGGTLSIMDITAALYLKVARHDPGNPNWDERDRIIWSAGHKAPALYLGLGMSGYFPVEEVVTLRKFDSPFQGHPHWLKLPGVEVSTGSLGQGFGIGMGMALRAKIDQKKFHTFIITGDGEWDEGSMWEAAMSASHHKLDNLTVIIDRNYLQIDGSTEKVMRLDPLSSRLSSFGFKVIKIDGHRMSEVVDGLIRAKKNKGRPSVIIAKTVKGKGVSFMENEAGWHGKVPNDDELRQALAELSLEKEFDLKRLRAKASRYQAKIDLRINQATPFFGKDYFWNKQPVMRVEMEPTRFGFGKALAKKGGDKRVIGLGLDISGSVQIDQLVANHPERKNRFISMGIQEQNGTVVAAGLARERKLPVISTYGVFCSQRNADQMRTTVCYGELNVLFAGAHGGVSVGPDGATHQSLEEIFVVGGLPKMNLLVPCDSIETAKAVEFSLFKLNGPKYIRFAREATPIVTDAKTPFVFGKANVIRLRQPGPDFKKAFTTCLAEKYKNENEKITIIACGPEVPEAMRAAWIMKEKYNWETRVINIHTIKPIDSTAIVRAAQETKIIVTAEEHQKGGLGNLVAAIIMQAGLSRVPKFDMVGVNDRFGESGQPWELIKAFGLSAEHIVYKITMLSKKGSSL